MRDINWDKVLGFSLLISILLTLSGAGWLALGLANPPRASDRAYPLEDMSTRRAYPLPADEFTLDILATIPPHEHLTTAWGVWLSDGADHWLIIALNGAQYITVRQCPVGFTGQLVDCPPVTTLTQTTTYWRRFHHIQPNGIENHLQINHLASDENSLGIWLNAEWVYAVPFNPTENSQWGLWQLPNTTLEWHASQSNVWINERSN